MTRLARTPSSFPLPLAAVAGLCLSVACVSLAGCASPSPKPAADAAAPKAPQASTIDFPVDHAAWSTLGYRLDWVGFPFKARHNQPIITAVSLGDCFVIQDRTSETVLLDAATGERRWGASLSNPLTKFVGAARDPVDPSRVLVSSESEGYLLAVATGSLVAKTRYERVVNTRPLLTGRVAIFGTSTGEIVSHVVNQSVKAWGFQTGGSIEADPVILADGDIGVVSQAGDVLFLNQTGQVIGRNRILSPVAMDPVTDGQSLYIAGLDQSIWAFASNGALRWRHRTSSPLSDQVAVRSGVVYCTVPGEGLLALSADDGKVLWKAQGTSGSVIASRDGRLLVRTASGIDMLNPANGSVVNKVALPGISLLVPESMDDGVIYAVSTRGTVAKFLPR